MNKPKTQREAVVLHRLVCCPVCGGKAERHACGPFMAGYGQAEWRNVVRCENHCTRGSIKDSWEDAESDWNDRLVRPPWFKGDASCDWHEDAGHENGSYYCKCLDCDADFVGHKRRHICRKCHYEAKARYDALTPEERAAFDEKRNAEIRAFFDRTNDSDQRTGRADDR
jgi:hypothetical protein